MTPARRAWYDLMISDEVRNAAYRKALAMYAPGRTVVDVGAGLGHLSLWALEAGAERVVVIESDEAALRVARLETLREHLDKHTSGRQARRCEFLGAASFNVHPSEEGSQLLGDVVVAEIFDSSGVGEGAIETLKDARRFLRPGGIMIPDWMRLHISPIFHKLTGGEPGKLGTMNLTKLGEDAGPAGGPWFDWCPGEEVGVHVQESGDVYGFGLAFTLGLAPGVTLTNLPGHPATHWGQGALPFSGPLKVERGQILIVRGEVDHSKDRLNPDVRFDIVRIEQ